MKTKQIVWGLTLVPLVYVMSSKSTFAVPETATMFFLSVLAVLMFLLSLCIYQMKIDIAKMQKTMDNLVVELRRSGMGREATEEPLKSEQQGVQTDAKKKLWHELEQEERDEHIAKICQSPFNIDPPKVSQEGILPQL